MEKLIAIESLFFELLQVAVGNRNELSAIPSNEEWTQIYQLCRKHSLIGIGFCGMRLLPEIQSPPPQLVISWTAQAEAIRQDNLHMNQECERLCNKLLADGFDGIIIKGQSNYRYYPIVKTSLPEDDEIPEEENLGCYRSPGDIDVLVRPCINPCIKKTIQYCEQEAARHNCTNYHIFYHDAEYCWDSETEVEVHYRAIWLNAPWRNAVLQRWLKSESQWLHEELDIDGIRFQIATADFNVIYHLLHVYKHLFEEGIGLRQLMDYYMVLRTWTFEHADNLIQSRESQLRLLRRFDCDRFAAAMMYVLQNVFSMPDEFLLCAPDISRGSFLLEEVMRAGNFGHYDDRLIGHREYVTLWHAWDKFCRNMKYIRQYPEEVLGEPLFSIWHWCWRKYRLWRF